MFIYRGRVAEVSDWAVRPSEEGKLIIRAEGHDDRHCAPRAGGYGCTCCWNGTSSRFARCASVVNISMLNRRFFLERHPKLAPVDTFTDGIFIARRMPGTKRHTG